MIHLCDSYVLVFDLRALVCDLCVLVFESYVLVLHLCVLFNSQDCLFRVLSHSHASSVIDGGVNLKVRGLTGT